MKNCNWSGWITLVLLLVLGYIQYTHHWLTMRGLAKLADKPCVEVQWKGEK